MRLASTWDKLKFWDTDTWSEIEDRIHNNNNILPSQEYMFKALELTPCEQTKIVILGQDPYPTKGHAHGLAFSVMPHVRPIPASLGRIFKEYQDDLGYPKPSSGSLFPWAERGVLLLNTILTVEQGKPNSHRGIGWEKLAYEVMKKLNSMDHPIVFMLWGKQAAEYKATIDNPKHLILTAAHPSPLARTGFLGCKHFSKACAHLGVSKELWRLQ